VIDQNEDCSIDIDEVIAALDVAESIGLKDPTVLFSNKTVAESMGLSNSGTFMFLMRRVHRYGS
jgi:hypothetical protein